MVEEAFDLKGGRWLLRDCCLGRALSWLKISSVISEQWGTPKPMLGNCARAVRTSPSGLEAFIWDWVKLLLGHRLNVSYLNILSARNLEEESDKTISADLGWE